MKRLLAATRLRRTSMRRTHRTLVLRYAHLER